jgi:hypothetical protein
MPEYPTATKPIPVHSEKLAPMAAGGARGFPELGANAVMTREQVAAWLQVRPRQVERLGVPCLDLGRKTKRYFAREVLAWIQERRVR